MKVYVARKKGGIPWWLIVGGIGFLIFGGWRGFFGAIAGVILIPIGLLVVLALAFYFWSLMIAKKHKNNFNNKSPFEFENQDRQGDIIETESTVIKVEKE